MAYKRYKMLQKYINGVAQEEYKQGELISEDEYDTIEECNEGNENPDKDIEGFIYQWVAVTDSFVCDGYDKYQEEKEQRSSDNGATWQDTGNTRQGSLIQHNSTDCGYIEYQYRWVVVENEYICNNYDKYEKEKQQRSTDGVIWSDTGYTRQGSLIQHNSTDCGYIEYEYRWVVAIGQYICVGYDKYQKEKEQRSANGGVTWVDTGLTRRGTLIERNSTDCGVSYTEFDCGIYFRYFNENDRLFVDNDAARFYVVKTLVNDFNGYIKVNFRFDILKDMPNFDWVVRDVNNVLVASHYIGNVVEGQVINDSFELPCGYYNFLYVVNHWYDGDVETYAMSRLTKVCNDCVIPPIYRWVVDENDYMCADGNKYHKEKEQISYDNGNTWEDMGYVRQGTLIEAKSADCGYRFRWVTVDGQYQCDGYDKYSVEKKQESIDGGSTWTDATPLQTRTGSLIEEDSEDCGYVPPTPSPYETQYLTIESQSDNNSITFRNVGGASDMRRTIQVSTDGGTTWVNKVSSTSPTVLATLNTGDKLLLKGTNASYGSSTKRNVISSSDSITIYGNIMSLIYGDNFTNETELEANYTFEGLFLNNTNLLSVENLVLPATTLYNWCYRNMFNGCTSITTAPVLPATTLTVGCYQNMFYGCTSLNYIKAMFTTTPSTETDNWVYGVAATGTFVKNSAASWEVTGTNGVPSGWTVVTE